MRQSNDSGLNRDHLEACPFCGSAAHASYDRMGLATNGRVHCVAMDCRADVYSEKGIATAITMWNRRAAPANQPAPTVPSNRVIVPTVPTDAMCIAAREKIGIGSNVADHVYRAMIAAHQPAQEQAEPVFVTRESALDAIRHVAESSVPGKTIRPAHMLVSAPVAQQEPVAAPCVICGSDEPRTGTCGSDDPRALCKQPVAAPGSIGDLTEFHVLLNWYDNEASYGSINDGRNKLTEYIDKWASSRAAQLDGGQEGSESNADQA